MCICDNTALPGNVDDLPLLTDVVGDTLIANDNAAGSAVRDQLIHEVFGLRP